MKCKECDCCHLGYFKSKPNKYVCTGVKEPFVISDINVECTEYKYKREATREDAIKHIEYQLENGYLDLGMHDVMELYVVKEAIKCFKTIEKFCDIPLVNPIKTEYVKKIIKE